jgi:hypothetical protein
MPRGYGRKTVLINSANRTNPSGTSTSNFIYTFPEVVKNVVHTHLQSAVIENAFVITQGVNDSFDLVVPTEIITNGQVTGIDPPSPGSAATTKHTITIAPGVYDAATLAWEWALKMNNINTLTNGLVPPTQSTFFVDINSTGYVSISNDQNGEWTLTFPAGTAALLGFNKGNISPPVSTNGPYVVRGAKPVLLTNNHFLIQSDRLGNELRTNQGFDAWCSITKNNTVANVNTISFINPREAELNCVWDTPRDIQWIDIKLIDTAGKTIDIADNNLQLLVEFYTDESARR